MLIFSLSEEFSCDVTINFLGGVLIEEEQHLVEVNLPVMLGGGEEGEDAFLGVLMVQSTLSEKTIILTIHRYYYFNYSASTIIFF
jgi:hypothetical protein